MDPGVQILKFGSKSSSNGGADNSDLRRHAGSARIPSTLESCFDVGCAKRLLSVQVPTPTGSPFSVSRDVFNQQDPRSPVLHSQVIRLRKEDQQLEDDIVEVFDTSKDRLLTQHLSSQVSEMVVGTPRAVSPSPLGMKTRSWPADAWESSNLERALHGSM
eukprot:c21149_g1_i1 orf=397-876(+)